MEKEFTHWVDTDGYIVAVSDNWMQFAHDNSWRIERGDVVGVHWSRFVQSAVVRDLYQQLMDYSYASGTPIELNYRCDSPSEKRFHRMVISWDPGRFAYRFANTMLRTEPLSFEGLSSGGDNTPSAETLTMCSWCKKVEVENGQRMEVEQALSSFQLSANRLVGEVVHHACPDCLDSLHPSVMP